ncbi:hypothetical protein GCM10010201_26970 [Pilimelia columellifera subsp. columellifera]|uniref:Uncharacterized protein n=1 Tax=Pilimelia columellifera subsp. columellifera TaxID=706583 RepID=A0ABN3NM00_9ACTN
MPTAIADGTGATTPAYYTEFGLSIPFVEIVTFAGISHYFPPYTPLKELRVVAWQTNRRDAPSRAWLLPNR